MNREEYREIPYNFTSADDRLIISHLFDKEVWDDLQELRSQRVTGRSARLVMRFMGDLFILRRNPFLYQELIDSPLRRRRFIRLAERDLIAIEKTAKSGSIVHDRSKKVLRLVHLCRRKLGELTKEISRAKRRRAHIERHLAPIIGKENIWFDPFALISHATDATDWRLFLPVAVLRPSTEEQVPRLLRTIAALGLSVIPRGGGTGLTGGAVPVRGNCVIINTEKLNTIHPIRYQHMPHLAEGHQEVAVLKVESGVVTGDAIAFAQKEDLVFATDPTSSWASTIGGNIAENAGGKKAVMWGTAIDNILSFNIAMPGTGLLTVRRIDHPMRKIMPEDQVIFAVYDDQGHEQNRFVLAGNEIRKNGLWKDITNKTLKGVPGLQKEGTDGIITSAEFVLHKAYPKKLTFCLEFYGEDMDEASRVIVKISEEFVNTGHEALMALEHFDEEYILAIQYKFKAARSEHPKAVLLIDMVGHTAEQVMNGKQRLENLLKEYANTELFTAQDADEAERFWRDRKRLGAISARTNAFKLNEDIVLPLPALAEFSRFVDQYNLDEDHFNLVQVIEQTMQYLETAEPIEDPDWLEAKIPRAFELCKATIGQLENRSKEEARKQVHIVKLKEDLLSLFSGYARVSGNIELIYEKVRSRRIVIATHMHAGDGNIHVNIPVFSNDRQMMKRAEKTAEDVMAKAVELGGAVSGEHGIGITKMKFLEKDRREELMQYRKRIDPNGIMNPGMLVDPEIIDKVFTPSFNLLELEARILQYGSLEALSGKIAKCVRCGKCMAGCCVYYPGSNIFFHPRNKNMVIGSLIEALLYDMQRSHWPRFNQLKNLEEIADHCTGCGKCLPPCPVNIDTAEVSVLERAILHDLNYKHTAPATRLSLGYLKSRNQFLNASFRKGVLELGGKVQRLGSEILKKAPEQIKSHPSRYITMLKSPMMPAPGKTLWGILPKCGLNEALMLIPKEKYEKTVFYFPGCGSERLYSDIGAASIYLLLKNNIRVIIPPPFHCCGFPAKINAKKKMYADISLRDSIVLSQIRAMLGYVVFDSFLVSCGTCRESLHEIGVEEIFNCRMQDISWFMLENVPGLSVTKEDDVALYHAPCHDSLDGQGAALTRRVMGKVQQIPSCCSEAGTLSLSRPDISYAMLQRKRDALQNSDRRATGKTPIITNCPSCISGLGRNREMGIQPKHLAVLLAENLGGADWLKTLPDVTGSAEKILF